MPVDVLTDAADPRLDGFRNLTDADVRPDRRGVVIAEGVNVVERLVRSPYRVRAVVGVPSRIEALAPVLAGVPAYAVDKWLLSEVVGFRVTRGVLASADRLPAADPHELLRRAHRVALLQGLNDFENLGALFRNAAAFGLDAVLLDPTCADPLYRRSVRVSMGHVLGVPFATLAGSWPEALEPVRSAGFTTLALTPRGDHDLRDVAVPPRWGLVFGAEGPGLPEATLAACDGRVRIPLADEVDSLNVATAAAVAFSHFSS